MPTSLAEIEQQACALAPGELPGTEAAWEREIESRVAAYDRGEMQAYAAEEVFADARRMARFA